MYKILIALLTILFFTTSISAKQLKFAQLTDIHLAQNGTNYGARVIQDSVINFENAVKELNARNDIEFIVFSGDNIDDYLQDDLVKFCEIAQKLNKPYYIGIGNHDAYENGSLTKKVYFDTVKKYNKNQKNKLPYYYFKANKDVLIVMLDGVVESIPTAHGFYSEEQIEWLDQLLTKNSKKKVIIVQHFPLIAPINKRSHSTIGSDDYLDVLAEHDNVVAVISGHYHVAKEMIDDKGVHHISSPALVTAPHQYRVITINYEKGSPEVSFASQLYSVEQKNIVPANLVK